MENWKAIKGFEGYYEVSDMGRVRRVDSEVNSGMKHNPTRTVRSRVLKVHVKRNGYVTVDLSKDNKVKTVTVHRLVAEAFLPKEEGQTQVNHINCNKQDNRVSNLEWCTPKENREHARDNGRYENPHKKAVRCVETGQVFESSYKAAEWVNNKIKKGSGQVRAMACKIRSCATGTQHTAYGFKWERV